MHTAENWSSTRLQRGTETCTVSVETRPYPLNYAVGGRGGYTVWVDDRIVGDECPARRRGPARGRRRWCDSLERQGWRRITGVTRERPSLGGVPRGPHGF